MSVPATKPPPQTSASAVSFGVQRIEEGGYGECDECGCEIDYARLEAQPMASRCVECQGQFEKTHAHKETPSL